MFGDACTRSLPWPTVAEAQKDNCQNRHKYVYIHIHMFMCMHVCVHIKTSACMCTHKNVLRTKIRMYLYYIDTPMYLYYIDTLPRIVDTLPHTRYTTYIRAQLNVHTGLDLHLWRAAASAQCASPPQFGYKPAFTKKKCFLQRQVCRYTNMPTHKHAHAHAHTNMQMCLCTNPYGRGDKIPYKCEGNQMRASRAHRATTRHGTPLILSVSWTRAPRRASWGMSPSRIPLSKKWTAHACRKVPKSSKHT